MFDLLSDFGGLQGIGFTIFAWFAGTWNFNNFDNMLVSNLFKIKRHGKQTSGDKTDTKDLEADFIKLSPMPNCLDIIYSLLPNCCICCNRNRRAKALAKARNILDKETNII